MIIRVPFCINLQQANYKNAYILLMVLLFGYVRKRTHNTCWQLSHSPAACFKLVFFVPECSYSLQDIYLVLFTLKPKGTFDANANLTCVPFLVSFFSFSFFPLFNYSIQINCLVSFLQPKEIKVPFLNSASQDVRQYFLQFCFAF